MSRAFVLPDLGEGLTEAEIIKVHVREGDVIQEDAPLLEVETDKAQVEIPSPMSGRVEKVHVRPGQTVKVGEVLVTFADGAESAAPRAAQPARAPAAIPAPKAALRAGAGPVPATPTTRRLARELGVDLRTVAGSGPGGRVTDEDVRAAVGRPTPAAAREAPARPTEAKPLAPVGLEPPPLPKFEQYGPIERQPLSHLRRTIAERMTLSATLIPHVTHFDKADITELDAVIRRNLEAARERGVTLTLTSFLLKAAALALQAHPPFNASLDPATGELILKRYYHLGIAVATDRGLIVNIGALGGTGAIPIINYPEVAILGVARAREEAVVYGSQIRPRLMLPLTLTFDHRVADGADGARFASDIVGRLEHPDQLLLDL
ncbi:MAG: 2-oxo acid dehydrogenase subunit E2 [Candidatus Rokubacteria bacterium]|nr:2-oxo acid dehydrogenase subunit E2 [Candidatus Rokubacteria bacterium]